MLLAELEIRHSRAAVPTRRVALGERWLPAEPPPGPGGILLGGLVAAHVDAIDDDLLVELLGLIDDLESDRRIPQPRLRHRFQTDVVGLDRSRHKLVAEVFVSVFADIQRAGLQQELTSFGGCFAFRAQRTGTKLSSHAWGIAVDLNPESNAQGTAGNMNAEVAATFTKAGFTWGGDWQGHSRDPMHFQFCSGY